MAPAAVRYPREWRDFEQALAKSRGFLLLECAMSICRDCPHFDFAVAITPDGPRGPRVAMDCELGMSMAGIREACELKPVRVDTGQRRRKTDMGGDAS